MTLGTNLLPLAFAGTGLAGAVLEIRATNSTTEELFDFTNIMVNSEGPWSTETII